MPAAAMHHAGVHWRQLQALEDALKEVRWARCPLGPCRAPRRSFSLPCFCVLAPDAATPQPARPTPPLPTHPPLIPPTHHQDVRRESMKWGGRLLLHQEFAASDLSKLPGGAGTGAGASNGGAPAGAQRALLPLLGGSFLTPPDNPVTPQVAHLRAVFASPSFAHAAATRASTDASAAAAGGGVRAGGAFGAGFPGQASPAAGGAAGGAATNGGADGLIPGISDAAVAAAAAQMAAASVDATPPGARLAGAPGDAGRDSPAPFPGFAAVTPGSGAAPAAAAPAAPAATPAPGGKPPAGPPGAAAAAAAAAGAARVLQHENSLSMRLHDDVTALVDARPGAAVIPFWEPVALSNASPPGGAGAAPPPGSGGRPPRGPPPSRRVLATPRDVAEQLAEEGFRVAYRRIPLSRDRTPVASDLQDLHAQCELRFPPGGAGGPPKVVHLVLSRTATGSSARFAAASLCTYLLAQGAEGRLPDAAPAGGSPARGASPAVRGLSPSKAAAGNGGGRAGSAGAGAGAPGSPPLKKLKRSMSDLGEYRGIISVTRLLPKGTEVKGAVDEAINRWGPGGGAGHDWSASCCCTGCAGAGSRACRLAAMLSGTRRSRGSPTDRSPTRRILRNPPGALRSATSGRTSRPASTSPRPRRAPTPRTPRPRAGRAASWGSTTSSATSCSSATAPSSRAPPRAPPARRPPRRAPRRRAAAPAPPPARRRSCGGWRSGASWATCWRTFRWRPERPPGGGRRDGAAPPGFPGGPRAGRRAVAPAGARRGTQGHAPGSVHCPS
jgi:hypothetical protein